MAKQEEGRIVETAKEARGAERGPSVRNVLVWSLGLVMAGFIVVYFMFFKAYRSAIDARGAGSLI
jgi:hypothetical protein